ncbi:MAG: folylpolyglutamate synthase/dihydrofolate synthase family protein [Bacteroidia bacterium]|nr:folylpolyglutamate synthase/dihydrofolate synthase family protein [Bacteroidia bacterium]
MKLKKAVFSSIRQNDLPKTSSMTEKTFSETLQYLYTFLPMYQRQGPVAFKKGLGNIQELCWALEQPQWKFKSIHIAGTNGKGSVSAMLNSVLMEAGYKTGMYTSPHLLSFTERMRVNGKEISQKEVVEFVEKTQPMIERMKPSFFELTVAMAFDFFAREEVDIAVIEVGLGGRLDSTNIIHPELSVITNISYDHTDLLGNTLGLIAEEKAGIIKRFTPVIIGEKHPETTAIFKEKAKLMEAPVFWAEDMFEVNNTHTTEKGMAMNVTDKEEEDDSLSFEVDQRGDYQQKNLVTTLAALKVLNEEGWEISDKAIRNGLSKTTSNSRLAGRMQILATKPTTICDTGHNEGGIRLVIEQLNKMEKNHLHFVLGMVSDKDHDKILALLPKDATYYFVKPNVPRGLDASILSKKAEAHGLKGETFDRVTDGVIAARKNAGSEDLIFIGGSTFVVADALEPVTVG